MGFRQANGGKSRDAGVSEKGELAALRLRGLPCRGLCVMVEPCAHESDGAAFGVHVGGRAEVRAVACLGHWQRGLGGIDGLDFEVGERVWLATTPFVGM